MSYFMETGSSRRILNSAVIFAAIFLWVFLIVWRYLSVLIFTHCSPLLILSSHNSCMPR
jgi:hypothetical protein